MKIAMIGHKRIPSREGGIEIVVEELATRIVVKGHQVHSYNRSGHHVSGKKNDIIISGVKNGQSKDLKVKYYKAIRIISVPTPQNKNLNAIVYSVLATLRALFGKYDVIHFHAEGPCIMIWLPKLFRIRTVATIHGLDWQRAKWGGFATKFLMFSEKIAVKYADEIIVLSRNMQNYFLDTYDRKTRYIPNGVNMPTLREIGSAGEKFGLEKDGYILFLARIVPEKGLHYLLEAYKDVDTLKKLVIAGGSSHSNGYVDEIKRIAALDGRVILTGFVQGEEFEELFSNCFLYVLPSDVEGMPISLLEAMSFGRCCLVSDIPENMEIVGDKAVSFKKGVVSDLKVKLEMLIENEVLVDAYKSSAQEYIFTKYNWDEVVDKTIELYQKPRT